MGEKKFILVTTPSGRPLQGMLSGLCVELSGSMVMVPGVFLGIGFHNCPKGTSMLEGVVIARPFIKATLDILNTMAGLQATAGKPFVKKSNVAKGDVSAIVGVTGDKTGTIAVSFSRACALALVKGMLGDDIQDILQDTQDAVGEVTNMVSGQARAALVDMGLTLQGSTPTVIMGEGHLIRHISANPVMAIPFITEHGDFVVEFCF